MSHWKSQRVTREGKASEAGVLWVGWSLKNDTVGQDLYLEVEITCLNSCSGSKGHSSFLNLNAAAW